MSIAASNLYTRNIYPEFINKSPTDKQEAQMAKWVSLIVKLGALVFIIFIPTKFAIYLQLLGGIYYTDAGGGTEVQVGKGQPIT